MILENDELDLIVSKITKSIIEIRYLIKKSFLDLSSFSNSKNNKIYIQSNNIFKKNLSQLNSIRILLSNNDNMYDINKDGKYLLSYDVIDDIDNLYCNVPVSTVFCVFEYSNDKIIDGRNIVMAGYSIYGLSTQLVICKYGKVDIFSLDCIIDKWSIIFSNYKIVEKGLIYSIDSYCDEIYNLEYKKYIKNLINEGYKCKNYGSLIINFHRILIKGGIIINFFSYKKLVFTLYPLAYILEKAEGMTLNENNESIINISFPKNLNEECQFIFGSEYEIFKLII